MEMRSRRIAVVMQRRLTGGRWPAEVWEAVGAIPGFATGESAHRIVASGGAEQWLYPDLELLLRKADADGYYLNVSTKEPKIFVMWREQDGRGVPSHVTVSYSEASCWMEGGEQVDPVPMPPELYAWVGEFVEKYYRPEPKRKIRPQSFRHPKDRART
ncbi:MAG TPA: DUF3305 domain-containing protein [Burkholderiales bacterium]|nr:DUF3305 domain-containing protein [Burkholderiales bacterium]